MARALVRILDKSGDHFGFGLLVGDGRVVTCAHVVAGSMGEPDELAVPPSTGRVRLEFPFIAPGQVLTAEATAWQAMAADGSGDVAGLVLDDEVPEGARPLAMTRGGNLRGHAILAYGYQTGLAGGVPAWVPGTIVDRTERGWLQLGIGEDAGGLRIRAGFSGTPVWDAQIGQVVGLVVRASMSRNVRLAFAVSGETVFDAWPDLRESFMRACPFRGLMPFQASDGNLFFGRDELTADVAGVITRSDRTVVSGPSGAGKTSLMNAGVIPQLERQGHAVITIRPLTRDSLWETLAAAVADRYFPAAGTQPPGAASDQQRTEKQLKDSFDADTAQSRVRRLCDCLGGDLVVVVVDQFEELLRAGGSRARAFTWDLGQLSTVRHPEGRAFARAVVVIREDDEAQLRSLPPFDGGAVRVVHVGALSAAQLRAAVEEPVRRTGFARYEDKLPDRIIDEIGVQPYVLPALQVVLTGLWERQGPDGVLRHSVYQELNRGAGPLATHLERLWQQVTPADRDAARRLLLHLVMPVGEDGFARRAAGQAEVNPGDWPIAGTLATQRLVVLRGSASGGAIAELVHDSLINQWPALADHLCAHRDFLHWRDDLRRRISAWEQSGRQPNQLLAGAALKRGLARQDTLPAQVSGREREFLRLSRSRARKLRRRSFAAAATVLTLIAGLLTFAVIQRQNASRNADVAAASLLINESQATSGTNPVIADLEAVAAWRLNPTGQGRYALLTAAARPEIAALANRTGSVLSVAFSPGGNILAVASADATVRLWNAATHEPAGQPIRLPPGPAYSPTGPVYSVAFSPDGKILATGDYQGTVRLWDTVTHQPVAHPIEVPGGPVYSVAFSPDGRTLATGDYDGTARLWNLNTGRAAGRPLATGSGVSSVAFSPAGNILATGNDAGKAQLWNVTTQQPVGGPLTAYNAAVSPTAKSAAVYSVAFSPDGKLIAAGDGQGTAQLWDVATRQPAGGSLKTGSAAVYAVAFSPDGRFLATGDDNGDAQLWSLTSLAPVGDPFTGHTGTIAALAFSPDGKTLATGGPDSTVRLWNLDTAAPITTLTAGSPGFPTRVWSVAYSPRGDTLATGYHGSAQLWDAATGRPIGAPIATGEGEIYSVAFSPGGKILATGSANGTVRLWNTATGRPIGAPLEGHSGSIYSVAFSPDGTILASGGYDYTIRLWDVATGRQLGQPLTGHTEAVHSVAFSPSGTELASGSSDGTVRLWDVAAHRQLGRPLADGTGIDFDTVAFSPDGKTLAAGTADPSGSGDVQIWDLSTRHAIGSPLTSNTGRIWSIAFSPDSKTLATGTGNGTVQLWDLATGLPIGSPFADGTGIDFDTVAYSPDGKTVAAGTGDPSGGGTIQLWDVSYLADPSARVCDLAGHSLTPREWGSYVPPGPAYQKVCP